MYICHEASTSAGWWHHNGQDQRLQLAGRTRLGLALAAEKLCLIHSEVSEAMEGLRKDLPDDKLPHRKMMEVELADALIRVCDLAGAMNFDLGGAVAEKLAYNATRADHTPEARAASGGKSF
jgi:NTP pyrophosphatase (non-canonical NTP hydrolase)